MSLKAQETWGTYYRNGTLLLRFNEKCFFQFFFFLMQPEKDFALRYMIFTNTMYLSEDEMIETT